MRKRGETGVRKSRRNTRVRVALIGAGGMANAMHYPSLSEMEDVDMVAISDLIKDRAAATAARFGIQRQYADYRCMLDETKPDAVYALMPPHHIFDVAINVLGRGHHLFIEKPPGLNAFQNRQMALCAEKHGAIAMCGFQRRYIPLINTMRARVEKRGAIHTAVVTFVKCSYPVASYYEGAIDILSCDAVHAVDTLRYLCGGEVVSLASDVRTIGADGNNAFYAIVKFSTGATGILQTNWACGRRFFKVEMHGLGISAYADADDCGMLYADGDTLGERFDPVACAGNSCDWHCLGFYNENRHFIDCVKTGTTPDSNLADTINTMELVGKIYASSLQDLAY
ncbi:MAG: Gfo/Idh/MocA family oxidoreductase [Candidatus Hydrogenedentes bacterium]|nr:Gfo/Idh/MocA family oxidoreductase [Candidatus Hydrogenedentota bacterium]